MNTTEALGIIELILALIGIYAILDKIIGFWLQCGEDKKEKEKEHKDAYVCKYCGKEFRTMCDCRIHEKDHIETFSDFFEKSNIKIAYELYGLYCSANRYQVGDSVMGMPVTNFENLMREAARRLADE